MTIAAFTTWSPWKEPKEAGIPAESIRTTVVVCIHEYN